MEQRSFFSALFDTSFATLITPKVVRVIYILGLIAIGLFAIVLVISGFADSTGTGLLVLFVLAPLGALLYTIYLRVLLEFVIVVFKIKDNTEALVELKGGGAPATAAPGDAPPSPGV